MIFQLLYFFYSKTPLHFACEKGFLPIVQFLIDKGIDINSKDISFDYSIYSHLFIHYIPNIHFQNNLSSLCLSKWIIITCSILNWSRTWH
jgi:ankyrin repeat protein